MDEDHEVRASGETRSVDDILNFIGYGPLQFLAFSLAGFTALVFGLEIVIFAFLDLPIQEKWNLSTVEYAVLPSATGLGNIVGGFLYGLLCDYYGRVWPYALILFHVGAVGLASAFAPNFPTLVVLRTIVSMAITGASTVMFSTLVEFLPPRNRGKIMVAVLVVQSVGVCSMGGLAWWLVPSYPVHGWRYIIVASSIPYFIPAVYRLIFSIQSPRFLISKGRYKEAQLVFEKMARINGKRLPALLVDECTIQSMGDQDVDSTSVKKCSCAKRNPVVSGFKALFKLSQLRTTLCLSVIFVIETGSYFSASTFLPSVLKRFGMDPYFVSFMGYLGQIPGIFLMSIIVEWPGVGRLNSLRAFSIMTMFSFILLAFVRNQAAIAVSVVLVYFSMVPMISLLYTYISEVYPTEVRAFIIGFYANLSSGAGLFLPYVSGYLAGVEIHWLFPTVWAAMFLIQFLVSLLLNVETFKRNLVDKIQ